MPREQRRSESPVAWPRARRLPSTQTALLAMIADAAPHRFTPVADELVVSDARASAEERVHVYAHMYRARIAEALESQFPRLARLLGADAFAALAFAYVTDHPSRHPSLRLLGASLPDWLESKYGSLGLSDLARLEWARSDVFDVMDEPTLTVEALRAWPLDAFMRLPVKLVAAHRLVTVDFAISAFWERIGATPEGGAPSHDAPDEAECSTRCGHADAPPIDVQVEAADSSAGESLLVWRQGAAIYHRVIADAEREALELAVAGTTFGAICETLPSWRPTEEVSAQAFSWLWSWTTAELLLAVAD
jgi:Putative DNA-binding domain